MTADKKSREREGRMEDFIIDSKADLTAAIEAFGFLPFFPNSIDGFSVEEMVTWDCWYHSDGSWPVWEWKGPVIRETGCAYGKFFEKKACYISPEWFPDFANYRRDGYDFDARWDDGLAPLKDKELYELVDRNAPILSKELKELGNYRKGGVKGFDTMMNRLQAQCYVIIGDFVYLRDKRGKPYGWGVAEYTTPEHMMGERFTQNVYTRTPQESYDRILGHFKELFPDEDEETLRRFLK